MSNNPYLSAAERAALRQVEESTDKVYAAGVKEGLRKARARYCTLCKSNIPLERNEHGDWVHPMPSGKISHLCCAPEIAEIEESL